MAATVVGRNILLVFMLFWCAVLGDECKIGSYDLTALESFTPWTTVNDNLNATFQISLCSKLEQDSSPGAHNCPVGTAVCAVFTNGTTISYGAYTSDPSIHDHSNEAEQGTNGELLMQLQGEACLDGTGQSYYTTFFYFKCGKTLGYPRYAGDIGCSTHFEWESYVFCKKLPVPEKEVPCTVVTQNGHLVDLSPLTKLQGAYLVDDDPDHDRKLFINVCRDITPSTKDNDDTQKCPKGAGSCKVVNGDATDFGQPTHGLELTDDGVKLVYTATNKPEHCLDTPTTTINFRCPSRGGSKDPVLLSDFLVPCSVEIDWVTEFACPTDHISSKTCNLTMEQHNVDINLSPLTRAPFSPYVVNVTDGQDHYMYYINVCGKLGSQCSDEVSTVCQKKADDETFHHSVGKSSFTELRYSDGQLTMTMRNGDSCSSNFRRATMIDFYCDKNAADDGKGYPEFVEHSNCSYFFKWGTKYACFDHPIDDTCRVNVDGKRFDLSPLVREQGSNWEVITGENEAEGQTYFINVCHDILDTGDAGVCPSGAAVCRKGSNEAVSLGHYTQSLEYDKASNSLRLNYTGGQEMKLTAQGCEAYTTVNFYCAVGDLESAPRLVHKSEDDCYHEIEWHTAAACVLSHETGDNCRVYDHDAGYTFDLNPLTLKTGNYTVSGKDGFIYVINVCASISDSNFCTSSPHDNAAICQVKSGSATDQKKIGEPSAKLQYYDGVLNLTYTNGEPYNDPDQTPRKAEIAFVCDMAADNSKPQFLEEKDFTYAFEWRTKYACPTAPVECVVTDESTHQQYDLSSLSRMSQNWETENRHDPNNKKKFYINVCRPLGPIQGVTCSAFASVCATNIEDDGKETLFHGNLGRAETAPTVETSIHGVKLVYTNGDMCTDSDGTTKKFKTSIHFSCVQGKVAGGPISPQLISPCEYSILWETEAACPIDSVKTPATNTSGCTVQDPNTGFVFNLNPLAKSGGYDVKASDGSKAFKVNICDGLSDDTCGKFDNKYPTSVCEVGLSSSTPQAMLSTNLEYSSQGEITLTYSGHTNSGTGSQFQYVFNFFCDLQAQTPVITYDGQSFLSTTFKVQTALACSPKPVSCVVQDAKGREFDLTPLAKDSGNWVVIDTRPNHDDLRYHINVCRPVNPTSEVTCPGGAVGGCQTSAKGDESFNMGYVQSEPVVSSSGDAITIVYKGGDKCHEGTDREAFRSTRIMFYCDSVEHNPVFEDESDTCEYSFVWKTPSACPQQLITGSDCKVTEPLYNFEFDLGSLRKTSEDYKVLGDGYEYLLNVCGPLQHGPASCGSGGVAACQTGPTLESPKQIGISNDKPVYDAGQISLMYTDGEANCHRQYNRSTIINFVCDHSQTGGSSPEYVKEQDDCTYEFLWRTSAACPPRQVVQCTYQSGDDVFDLSRLTMMDGNYEKVLNDSQKMYIINVCHSLVHKKDQTCPFDAAACMIDLSETDPKKKFHNIGEVTSHSFSYEHGTLILKYENGELCSDGKKHRSTVILFQCDESSDALGVPGGHFTLNDCEDHFVWSSSAACPLKRQQDGTTVKGFGDCRVANPSTGYTFDLSSLKKPAGYVTTDRQGHQFTLNVCGYLDSSSQCRNGTGSCQLDQTGSKKSYSAGDANANLLYRDGVLVLEYRGGETCSSSNEPRTTIINFVCSPGSGNGVPVFIDKSGDCLYYFDWHTDLACETEVLCEVNTISGYTLDFSSLVKKSGKYNVIPNTGHQQPGMIYINLCRPLNPIYGTLCPAGSGACLVQDGKKPLSLGKVSNGPVYDSGLKQVKLTYNNGDPCPSDPSVNMTSVILLKCGSSDQLDPELDGVTSECQYIFMWETPLACEENTAAKLTSECTFYDHDAETKYDLSSLSDSFDVTSDHGGTFHLKPCGQLEKGDTSCADSSVCLSGNKERDGSYGVHDRGLFQKDGPFIALTFSQGRECHSGKGKAESTIYFMCDRTAGKGTPTLMDDDQECEANFRWNTDLVCPPEREECVITSAGNMFDFTFLSQDTGSWNYTDTDKNVYWLNLCQTIHGSAVKAGCPPEAAVCRKTSGGKVQMLGRLDTQTITVKDKTVEIQYSEGDADICNTGRRRRSDLYPKVVIELTCGDTVGAPVFQQDRPENLASCIFEFKWKTKMACPVGMNSKPLKESNGKIFDSRTQRTIDLNPLLTAASTCEISARGKKYLIHLGHPVTVDSSVSESSKCKDAAICQTSVDSKTYKNLGSFSSKTYHLQDDHLEVVFTSPEKCSGKQNNITTTIFFNCRRGEALTQPEFFYQSDTDCAYFFHWDTSIVCLYAVPSVIQPGKGPDSSNTNKATGGSSDSDSGISGTSIAIIVGVMTAIVVACILALVLHKPERRAAIGSKLKTVILCRKTQEAPIVYSRLSQADTDVEDIRDPFNPFDEPEEEAEINNSQLPARVETYHDSSDEDMLL